MKKITYSIIVLLSILFINVHAKNIDSLQRELNITTNDSLKAGLYSNIAAELIQYNMPNTHSITYSDAEKAVSYVLKAIHFNSKFDDTLAIRDNFDCLARAYFIQKKYTQAKWFNLQSNYISRSRKDVPRIIYSLIQLANVKATIKDYRLAKKDLDEALVLAKYINNVPYQLEVQKSMILFYNAKGDYKAADIIEKNTEIMAANPEKFITKPKPVKVLYAMQKPKAAKVKKHMVLQETLPALVLQDEHTAPEIQSVAMIISENN